MIEDKDNAITPDKVRMRFDNHMGITMGYDCLCYNCQLSIAYLNLHEENQLLRKDLEKIRDDFDGNNADLMTKIAENALKEQPK